MAEFVAVVSSYEQALGAPSFEPATKSGPSQALYQKPAQNSSPYLKVTP